MPGGTVVGGKGELFTSTHAKRGHAGQRQVWPQERLGLCRDSTLFPGQPIIEEKGTGGLFPARESGRQQKGMMMKTRKLSALCVMVLLGVSLPVWAGGKKKVVVLDFDSAAVQKSVQRIFGAQVDVGRGLSELVAQYLDVDGTYQPVEREKVEKVLSKQEFAQGAAGGRRAGGQGEVHGLAAFATEEQRQPESAGGC